MLSHEKVKERLVSSQEKNHEMSMSSQKKHEGTFMFQEKEFQETLRLSTRVKVLECEKFQRRNSKNVVGALEYVRSKVILVFAFLCPGCQLTFESLMRSFFLSFPY